MFRIRITFLGYSRIVQDLALLEYAKNRIDYVCVMKHNAKSTVCDAESGIKEKNDYHCLKNRLTLVVGSAIIRIDKCYTSTINKN